MPEVWRSKPRMVIGRVSGTVFSLFPLATATPALPNPGRYFVRASSKRSLFCSINRSAATVTIGFVIELMRKIASAGISGPLGANLPKTLQRPTLPFRKISREPPGKWPLFTNCRKETSMLRIFLGSNSAPEGSPFGGAANATV